MPDFGAVAPVLLGNSNGRACHPQGEAIQCTRMDCFTLRVRNDGAAGRLLKCSVFFPMTIHDLHFATI
jgi:hypothetical protein